MDYRGMESPRQASAKANTDRLEFYSKTIILMSIKHIYNQREP